MSITRAADVWYIELQVAEQGMEYRYLVVQVLRTEEMTGLRVVRRETFIHPRRLSLNNIGTPTEGTIISVSKLVVHWSLKV